MTETDQQALSRIDRLRYKAQLVIGQHPARPQRDESGVVRLVVDPVAWDRLGRLVAKLDSAGGELPDDVVAFVLEHYPEQGGADFLEFARYNRGGTERIDGGE